MSKLLTSDPRYLDYVVVRSNGLLRTVGEYNLELTNGKFETFVTVGETRYRITRTLPNHVVDAIYRLAAGRYPITLEFIVEFLKRSNDKPILEHHIVIPPEVTNFFDELKLPQDQSALWHLKLFQAKFEYENALKLLHEIDERIKDEKSDLAILVARNSKKWNEFEDMLSSLDQTQIQMDALIAFNSSVKSMKEAFGPKFTLPTIDSSLPTIDDLREQISELKRVIARENFKLQPARYEEVDVKKTSLWTLTKRLEEATKSKEQSLRQIELYSLNIQRKKLGLTEIA